MSEQERRQAERRGADGDRLQTMAREAGRQAARDVLLPLGIDIDDGDSFRGFTADMAFLRRSREQSERFSTGWKLTILSVFASALAGGLGWFITFVFPPKH